MKVFCNTHQVFFDKELDRECPDCEARLREQRRKADETQPCFDLEAVENDNPFHGLNDLFGGGSGFYD